MTVSEFSSKIKQNRMIFDPFREAESLQSSQLVSSIQETLKSEGVPVNYQEASHSFSYNPYFDAYYQQARFHFEPLQKLEFYLDASEALPLLLEILPKSIKRVSSQQIKVPFRLK